MLLYLLYFLVFNTHSSENTHTKFIKVQYDLNKDGRIDRIESRLQDHVVRVEEDRNFDSYFDYKESYDNKDFYLILEQDTNFDSKIDFKKTYSHSKNFNTRITTEIDHDFDGKFDQSFSSLSSDFQKNVDCFRIVVQNQINNFSNMNLNIVNKLNSKFLNTGFGFKIEQSCLAKWGGDFKNIVRDSVKTGLQCLNDLSKKYPTRMNGALRNAFSLTEILKKDQISLVCSQQEYSWNDTRAHASTKVNTKMDGRPEVTHPFISLNPSFPLNKIQNRNDEIKKIKETIFHETLHNLGFRHGEDIEFSYGCGACCFENENDASTKDAACKICLGDYKNELDLNYIADFVDFAKLSYKQDFAFDASSKLAKSKSKQIEGIIFLADSSSGIFNPLGKEITKIISSKYKGAIDPKLKERLLAINSSSEIDEFKSVQISSKTLSMALFNLYYDHNAEEAIRIISQNKAQIKKEIQDAKKKGGDHKWVAEELYQTLDKIIYDVWINKFPNEKASDQAYELHGFFKSLR